jgi:hypothetical protein
LPTPGIPRHDDARLPTPREHLEQLVVQTAEDLAKHRLDRNLGIERRRCSGESLGALGLAHALTLTNSCGTMHAGRRELHS